MNTEPQPPLPGLFDPRIMNPQMREQCRRINKIKRICRDMRILVTKNRLACNPSARAAELSHCCPMTSANPRSCSPEHPFAIFEIPEERRAVMYTPAPKTHRPNQPFSAP